MFTLTRIIIIIENNIILEIERVCRDIKTQKAQKQEGRYKTRITDHGLQIRNNINFY